MPVPASLAGARCDLVQAIEDVPFVARYLQLARVDLAVHGSGAGGPRRGLAARVQPTARFPDPVGAFRPFALSMTRGRL